MASELVFIGDSSSNGGVVWVSNGKAGGTKQIKFKNQASAGLVGDGNELGLIGPTLLSFDGDVYVAGEDAQGHVGLFLYNSTTGSATEVLGLTGFGLDPQDFVAYDGKVYFNGLSFPNYALWVTNGLKSGTHAITSPILDSSSNPSSMTVYDGDLYMAAEGADGDEDLFAYNAGSGAFKEISEGLAPQSMAAASVGSTAGSLTKELFLNGAVSGKQDLVVFDGSKQTSFPTEAKNGGVAPSDIVGLTWKSQSGGQTLNNGAAFFPGVDDASGHRGFWESNGATVKELAASTFRGSPNGLDPYDLTAFDGKIYFTGYDNFQEFGDGRGLFQYNPATGKTTELIKSTTLDLMDGFVPFWGTGGDLNQTTMGVFDGKLYFGALNPQATGSASVPQLYEYSGSGASATLLNVAGTADGGLAPGWITSV